MNAESNQVKKAPFRAGRDVYSGPQQLALSGGIKRALIAPDSVLTLCGQVGTGKTVSARHALSRSSHSAAVARIGRVHLHREDVLEVLLDEFNVRQKPASALQRFSALKRLLINWSEVGTDVFVIVEDVERLGVEALAELESLTAADDDTPGAHIILMGTPTLGKLLQHPLLARLKQRVRRNLTLDPFSIDETRGYIAHCLSSADQDANDIFEDGAIDVIHACSGGVARVINNVAETMMIVAAETGSGRVTEALARNIAVEDFDFDANDSSAAAGRPDRPYLSATDWPEARTSAKEEAVLQTSAPVIDETPTENVPAEPPSAFDADIPALIQDTLPPMPALSATELQAANQTDAESASGSIQVSMPAQPAIDEAGTAEPVLAPPKSPARRLTSYMTLEPRVPEPLSKSSETADTQTMKALDNALRPDTQLLRTLEEPVAPQVDDAPVPLGLRKEIMADRSRHHSSDENDSIPTLDSNIDLDDSDLPTLSNSMRFDAEEAPPASAGSSPAEARDDRNPGGDESLLEQPSEPKINPAPASQTKAAAEPPAADPESSVDAPPEVASIELCAGDSNKPSGATQAPSEPAIPGNGKPSEQLSAGNAELPEQPMRQANAATADMASANASLSLEETPDNELPDISLVPEITLDKSLDNHQQEAQARLAVEAERRAAAAEPDASEGSPSSSDPAVIEAEKEAERKKRLESLAARFESAKSLEDVMDDTAAETLFGEEFSQIAAAVTAMHEAGQQESDTDDNDIGTASNDPQTEAQAVQESSIEIAEEPADKRTAPKPDLKDAVPEIVAQANVPRRAPGDTAPRQPGPKPANSAAAPSPAALDSSAAQRLEMVRALNKKAGKSIPVVPDSAGEEIVLGGSDSSPTSSGPKPERIENQFGLSMTATLKALSAENIKSMQEEEENKEKKKGLLSRFRRS